MLKSNSDILLQRKPKSKSRKFVGIVLNILLLFTFTLLCFAVYAVVFMERDDVFLFGHKPYIIISGSMEPAFHKYAVVVVRRGGYKNIDEGDIIAFKEPLLGGQSALHRVVKVTPDGLITKGDANEYEDANMVTQANYIGRGVWFTNFTADFAGLIQTVQGMVRAIAFFIVLPIILIVFIVMAVKIIGKFAGKPS